MPQTFVRNGGIIERKPGQLGASCKMAQRVVRDLGADEVQFAQAGHAVQESEVGGACAAQLQAHVAAQRHAHRAARLDGDIVEPACVADRAGGVVGRKADLPQRRVIEAERGQGGHGARDGDRRSQSAAPARVRREEDAGNGTDGRAGCGDEQQPPRNGQHVSVPHEREEHRNARAGDRGQQEGRKGPCGVIAAAYRRTAPRRRNRREHKQQRAEFRAESFAQCGEQGPDEPARDCAEDQAAEDGSGAAACRLGRQFAARAEQETADEKQHGADARGDAGVWAQGGRFGQVADSRRANDRAEKRAGQQAPQRKEEGPQYLEPRARPLPRRNRRARVAHSFNAQWHDGGSPRIPGPFHIT